MEKPSTTEDPGAQGTQLRLAALERELSVLVRRTLRALGSEVGEEGVLERSTYALLLRLSEEGPMRVGALARRFGINRSTASRHVGRLEEQGLVKAVPDESDGRSARLSVTPRGLERLAEARETRLKPLQRVFSTWSEEEVLQLTRLLAQLNRTLDQFEGA